MVGRAPLWGGLSAGLLRFGWEVDPQVHHKCLRTLARGICRVLAQEGKVPKPERGEDAQSQAWDRQVQRHACRAVVGLGTPAPVGAVGRR